MKNPWLGLKSYEEGDRLYGRGKEADELANIVMNSFHTIIYGKSGIGKTSLLRAGVFPTLRYEDFLPIYIRLEHDENADEDSYLRQIENALKENQCSLTVETERAPSSGISAAVQTEYASSLQSIFSKYRFSKSRGISLTPVIVFDQFEEIFTLNENRNSAAVDKFFADLSDILNNDTDSHNYRIVFCLREDYLYYIERLSESIPAFKRNRYCLQDLTHDEAMEVITLDNCNSAGVETHGRASSGTYVDVNTAEEILHKISPDNAEEYNATILSLYMSQLFDKMVKAGATTITSSLVQQFGDDIISAFYFDSIAGISEKSIEYLEDHLVTTGGYRHNIPLEDAITSGVRQPEIDHLKDRRIINIQPRQGNILYMEYAHDVLCPIIVENRGQRALRKKAKRQRRLITVAVVLVLFMLGIVGGFVWEEFKISQSRDYMLKMQSAAMAGQAEQMFNEGSYEKGVALCLRALPKDLQHPDRPFDSVALTTLMSCMESDFANCVKVVQQQAPVMSAEFSPDGRYVVTACGDKTVRISDAGTGKMVKVLKGHTGEVKCATYSADGRYIASSSFDTTIRIWNVETGKTISVMRGHKGRITSVSFSPDGKYIASSAYDSTVRIWNAKTGKLVRILRENTEWVEPVSFSPDGRYIVAPYGTPGDQDNWVAVIWDVATGKKIRTLDKHPYTVQTASYSSDGKYIATAGYRRPIYIWDAATGKKVKTLDGYEESVNSVAISPDCRYVVAASDDKMARIWNVETGELVKTLKGHEKEICSVAFSPDGKYVVTASRDKSAMIWGVESLEKDKMLGNLGALNPASISPDGRNMVVRSDEGTVICNVQTGERVRKIENGSNFYSSAFSPDGRLIVSSSTLMMAETAGNEDSVAYISDARTGKLLRTLEGHNSIICSAFFSPDSRYVITSSFDSTARIWNAMTGKPVKILRGHKGALTSASYSSDGRYVVTSSVDSTAVIWDAATWKKLKVLKGHTAPIFSASFSPDGKYVATASADSTARIWSVETGEQVRVFDDYGCWVLSASFSPDGCFLATSSCDNVVMILDVATGKIIRNIELELPTSVYFTPDERYIVICSDIKQFIKVRRFYKPQEVIDHFRKVVGDYKFTEDEEIKYYLK